MAIILSEEELNELRLELETTTDEKRRKEIEQDLEYGCRADGTDDLYRQLRISRLKAKILGVIIAVLFMYLSLCAIQIAPEVLPEIQEPTFFEIMKEALWECNIFRVLLGK